MEVGLCDSRVPVLQLFLAVVQHSLMLIILFSAVVVVLAQIMVAVAVPVDFVAQ
jgi:hypothetical protein